MFVCEGLIRKHLELQGYTIVDSYNRNCDFLACKGPITFCVALDAKKRSGRELEKAMEYAKHVQGILLSATVKETFLGYLQPEYTPLT